MLFLSTLNKMKTKFGAREHLASTTLEDQNKITETLNMSDFHSKFEVTEKRTEVWKATIEIKLPEWAIETGQSKEAKNLKTPK